MNITIKTIAQKDHRYSTAGDWLIKDNGNIDIKVSKMTKADYEFMIAVHELIEAYLCVKRGITEQEVTAFDVSDYGLSLDDPGKDRLAPYRKEHMFALKVEKLLARELKVNWNNYEKALDYTCPTESK